MLTKNRVFLLIFVVLTLLCACSVPKPREKMVGGGVTYLDKKSLSEREQARFQVSRQLFYGLRNYRILPGDVLDIMYLTKPVLEEEVYRVKVGDKLSIDFRYHEDFSRECVVRPDGRITLPYKGDLFVAGKTTSQIARDVARRYSSEFRDPVVTVSILEYTSNVKALKESLGTSQRGLTMRLTVGPDGSISLPYLGSIHAAGKSVEELENIINRKYSENLRGVKASVLLAEAKGQRIFVFGAVKNPGFFPVSGPVTIVQAISMAGGLTVSGDIHNVGVLYWDDNLQPRVRTISISRIINDLKVDEDLILPPNSVVYVPLSPIAKVGLFVKQYIKDVIMFNGASLGFSYELHSEGGDD